MVPGMLAVDIVFYILCLSTCNDTALVEAVKKIFFKEEGPKVGEDCSIICLLGVLLGDF